MWGIEVKRVQRIVVLVIVVVVVGRSLWEFLLEWST